MNTPSVSVPLLVLVLAACAGEAPERAAADPAPGLENGSFHAQLDGFDIHYEVRGQGPVLMTLPNSWGLSLAGLRAMYRPLEAFATLVYFDPRGMGESGPVREDADMGMAAVRADFDALRRHLGLDRVNVIGWSNGAMNLILLAAERPDTLERAIFLHGAASFTDEDGQKLAAERPELVEKYGHLQEVLASDAPDEEKQQALETLYLDEWFPLQLADREASIGKVRAAFADAEFSWRHAQHEEQENPQFEARDRLASIRARSLVISGTHDLLPPSKGEEIAAGIPDAELVIFENSGHFAPLEETDRFVATVRAFLEP